MNCPSCEQRDPDDARFCERCGALGDAQTFDRGLRQALDLYRAIGATGHVVRLAQELGT